MLPLQAYCTGCYHREGESERECQIGGFLGLERERGSPAIKRGGESEGGGERQHRERAREKGKERKGTGEPHMLHWGKLVF